MTPKAERLTDAVTLYEGRCEAVLASLSGIDAVVTDPPYGVEFKGKNTKHTIRKDKGYACGFDDAKIGPKVVGECIERFGRVVVTVPAKNAFDYPRPIEIGSVFCPSGAGLGSWGFIGTHPIFYYGKCPYLAKGMGHRPNSFRSFATSEDFGHPCSKPVEWMRWLVVKATLRGETVLDPFAGSGTTAIAAMQEGRRCILIEQDPHYCEIIRRRVREADGAAPGTLFREVARRESLFADEPEPEVAR